jgi:hypothetical protein
MNEIKNSTIIESIDAVVQQFVYYLTPRALVLAAIVFFAFSPTGRTARLASAQALAKGSGIVVYAAPDETSLPVETVRDGGRLSPIAETTSAGVKWFMVKTKSGSVGWIKAGSNAETKQIDDYFRTLPKDTISVGPPSSAPEPATRTAGKDVSRIPILIRGPRVYVVVTFNRRVSGYLLVDTGAYQTVVSKRMASELRLRTVDRRMTRGVAGSFTHDVGLLDSIRVGAFELRNFQVSIFDHTSVPNDEGLLGFDFLGLFHMSVDPEKQEMILTPRKK